MRSHDWLYNNPLWAILRVKGFHAPVLIMPRVNTNTTTLRSKTNRPRSCSHRSETKLWWNKKTEMDYKINMLGSVLLIQHQCLQGPRLQILKNPHLPRLSGQTLWMGLSPGRLPETDVWFPGHPSHLFVFLDWFFSVFWYILCCCFVRSGSTFSYFLVFSCFFCSFQFFPISIFSYVFILSVLLLPHHCHVFVVLFTRCLLFTIINVRLNTLCCLVLCFLCTALYLLPVMFASSCGFLRFYLWVDGN